ncbi:unnamed protein product [Allacma fusca]|uniref:Uncharacterized protein n=1 Tax=Allacma fusca TaxID=39272 RepID=A0A8J2LST3_9HEXA|nr:unnamed protein product [Allacma fusca]
MLTIKPSRKTGWEEPSLKIMSQIEDDPVTMMGLRERNDQTNISDFPEIGLQGIYFLRNLMKSLKNFSHFTIFPVNYGDPNENNCLGNGGKWQLKAEPKKRVKDFHKCQSD